MGGLHLPCVDGQDAAPNNLGDMGGRVDDKRQHHRHIGHLHPKATRPDPILDGGLGELERPSQRQEGHPTHHDQGSQGPQRPAVRSTRVVEHPSPPCPNTQGCDNAAHDEQSVGPEVVQTDNRGERESTVAEDHPAAEGPPSGFRCRTRPEWEIEKNGSPQEHNHQQGRDVPEELDVSGCQLPQQPVGRQACDTNEGPEQHRKRNPQEDYQKRVLDPLLQGVPDTCVRTQRVVSDGDPRRLVQETEGQFEADIVGAVPEIGPQPGADSNDEAESKNLSRQRQNVQVTPWRWTIRGVSAGDLVDNEATGKKKRLLPPPRRLPTTAACRAFVPSRPSLHLLCNRLLNRQPEQLTNSNAEYSPSCVFQKIRQTRKTIPATPETLRRSTGIVLSSDSAQSN